MRQCVLLVCVCTLLLAGCATVGGDRSGLVTTDRYVPVKSTAPSMQGQVALLYVREVRLASGKPRAAAGAGVVLFVNGAGTPAEVSFDVPYADYSWMAYLVNAGFDVFSMDMTGYGRSTRPIPMNDPCNFPKAQQAQFVPKTIPAACAPSYPTPITTMASDWNDIAAVVEHLRTLRGVDKCHSSDGRKAVRAPPATPLEMPTRSRGWSCSRRPSRQRTVEARVACAQGERMSRSAICLRRSG